MGGLGASAILAHLVAMAVDRGAAPEAALLGISVLAASNLAFQGILGRIYDRLETPRIAAPAICVMIVGVIVISNAHSAWMFAVGGLLMGVGAGADYSFLPYALQRYFGLKAYGEIYGSAFGINAFVVSGGPLLLALSHDLLGSYNFGIGALVILFAISAVIMFKLPPYARTRSFFTLPAAPEGSTTPGYATTDDTPMLRGLR
jgi:MFS family permease